MGRAKAWLPWGEGPLLSHVVAVLAEIVDEVVVVSSADLELPELEARVVMDRAPALGPLAGIREGLAAIEADLAYVTSVDSPFLTPHFVRTMLSFGTAAAAEVEGYVQTLSAVYPRSALPAAEELLAAKRMRPLFLLEAADYRTVTEAELPDQRAWRGFNTPEQYLEAVREAFGETTAHLEVVGRARLALGREVMEVPVGTLAEVLACTRPSLELLDGERVASPYLVSLDGRDLVRDARVPIGPGERVIVIDAQAGG